MKEDRVVTMKLSVEVVAHGSQRDVGYLFERIPNLVKKWVEGIGFFPEANGKRAIVFSHKELVTVPFSDNDWKKLVTRNSS